MYKLIDTVTNREIKIGSTIWSFRGEAHTLEAVYETKVLVSRLSSPKTEFHPKGPSLLYYPSVFNAKITKS